MTTEAPATVLREARGVHSEHPLLHGLARLTVLLVAVGAAVLSFDALTALARASGIHESLAWIWAVVIDGFILVATIAAFAMNRRSKSSRVYAWTCLALFTVFSIIGNGWHAAILASPDMENALPLWMAITVTGIPPVALFLAIHLLFIMLSPTDKQEEDFRKAALAAEREAKKRARNAEAEGRRKTTPASQPVRPAQPLTAQTRVVTPEPAPATARPVSEAQAKPLTAEPSTSTPLLLPVQTTPTAGSEEKKPVQELPWLADFGLKADQLPLDRVQANAFLKGLEAQGLDLPSQARLGTIMGVAPTSGARMMKRYQEGTLVPN